MKILKLLTPFCLLLCLTGCKKDSGYRVDEYRTIKVEELPADIKIPSKAWDQLEMKSAEAGHEAPAESGHGGGGGGGAPSAAKNFTFAEVAVYLVQKNEGVVEGEAIKIALPKGGGTVDLSRYITSQQGSFYVGFEFPSFETATAKKVLFVSHTRKRKIAGQIFGAGCNQIVDITTRFLSEMKGEGIKVNTTQERYVSVLGGTFLFAAQKDSDTYLAQVTFVHPQYQHLFCEEK